MGFILASSPWSSACAAILHRFEYVKELLQ